MSAICPTQRPQQLPSWEVSAQNATAPKVAAYQHSVSKVTCSLHKPLSGVTLEHDFCVWFIGYVLWVGKSYLFPANKIMYCPSWIWFTSGLLSMPISIRVTWVTQWCHVHWNAVMSHFRVTSALQVFMAYPWTPVVSNVNGNEFNNESLVSECYHRVRYLYVRSSASLTQRIIAIVFAQALHIIQLVIYMRVWILSNNIVNFACHLPLPLPEEVELRSHRSAMSILVPRPVIQSGNNHGELCHTFFRTVWRARLGALLAGSSKGHYHWLQHACVLSLFYLAVMVMEYHGHYGTRC